MLTVAHLEAFYNHFYQHKYKVPDYKLRQTKTTLSVCNSFLKIVDTKYSLHAVGEDFLWDYFIFQFQYWHTATLENNYSDKIIIAWIVGKKAFERWEERDREKDWMIDKAAIINLYGLDKNSLYTKREQVIQMNNYDSSAPIRKKYLNTDEGFALCVQFTTLFNPSDFSCIRCKNRVDCKELLRVNYSKLYQQRVA